MKTTTSEIHSRWAKVGRKPRSIAIWASSRRRVSEAAGTNAPIGLPALARSI
jgi:hypothetical protein